MNRNDKRASVCGLEFLPIGQAIVEDLPGNPHIKVTGSFTRIPIASGEFRESEEPGNPIEQELEAVVTGTSTEILATYRNLFVNYGLVRLTMTNGDRKVIGNNEFPVLVSTNLGGSPQQLTLSFKRESPEPAKEYSSF